MTANKSDRVTRETAATRHVGFTVNGQYHEFRVGSGGIEISPTHTLSWTLREVLGLMGTKVSCDSGACGSCTVIMDGKAVLSCKVLTIECDGKTITTIEGLRDPKTGALDPIQQSFIDHTAFQCGYCTPGMIMTAKAFLNENPQPTEEEIKDALSGNFCRCISHYQVIRAVMSVVEKEGEHGR
ncbi:MAG: (2Fe-2S)-binding protein [Desulfomonile tiedjei]|uniref:(2Fe-2S)-binding protein n=1 Tax=Desulfomonile tiedjei TaxID=2358 RepID=A0A9D6V3Z5_9BACT|nr:(2Fe-2S)-binding protein [Desulfomonile tiedjei]